MAYFVCKAFYMLGANALRFLQEKAQPRLRLQADLEIL
jgi:hypothetical protein